MSAAGIGVYEVIEDDLFGIAARIKSIDGSYFVVRNYKAGRFEVHSAAQRSGTFALALPFDTLDERAVRFTLKTRAERKKALMEEIETENAGLEKEAVYKRLKRAEHDVEEFYGKV